MGKVPNLFRILAHAPAALDVYTGSKQVLHDGVLSPQAQEQIAIAVAAAMAVTIALPPIPAPPAPSASLLKIALRRRRGAPRTPRFRLFSTSLWPSTPRMGQASAPALETARSYGLSDAEILETVAHVAVNILTNSVNNIVGTVLDFPKVDRVA